jgi:hypothetical protein
MCTIIMHIILTMDRYFASSQLLCYVTQPFINFHAIIININHLQPADKCIVQLVSVMCRSSAHDVLDELMCIPCVLICSSLELHSVCAD